MQKAIELNDNRAVYRSVCCSIPIWPLVAPAKREFTVISVPAAGVGRKAGNQSTPIRRTIPAHRFLADSYSSLPRHEIARVSELLQSQLLQPLNMTPIQPHLAESNLFLISAGGPAALSFNEFNPLFTRNRFALQASGVFGSNYTLVMKSQPSPVFGTISPTALGSFIFRRMDFGRIWLG